MFYCFIVLHCVLAAFCQLLLNEYCIVLYSNLLPSLIVRHSVKRPQRCHHQLFPPHVFPLSSLVGRVSFHDQVALAAGSARAAFRLDGADLVRHEVEANDEVTAGHVEALLCHVGCHQQVAAPCVFSA